MQIYEELATDPKGRFTTSFLAHYKTVKDNRLLPRGWSEEGPDPSLPSELVAATHPVGRAWDDRSYRDGSGCDQLIYEVPIGRSAADRLQVVATMYYQAIPPYYLRMRFSSSQGPATRRLHYLTSHLRLEGTPIEGWKLKICSAEARVP